jgi:hypothetical protein
LASILATGPLVLPGPEGELSQASEAEARRVVAFVQRRLAGLGCFDAVEEPRRQDGTFEALTANAVIASQQANGLLADPRLDSPGIIRPKSEFKLLGRPFPFLFGPVPCRDPPRLPDAGDPHVQFDERVRETEPGSDVRH